jgi:hypothetical protein
MNLTGSVKMLDLNSFKIVSREHSVILHMTQTVIERLNRTALAEGRKHTIRFAGGPDIFIDIEGVRGLPDLIVPADDDIGAIQQPEPASALAIEGGDAPIADQDVPMLMPDEDPLPVAPIDPVVVQDIINTLLGDGYVRNKYDVCCYNKSFPDGIPITCVIHVDDLMITSKSQAHIESLILLLKNKYKDIKVNTGSQLGYLGLVLDFSIAGSVLITAPGFTDDLLMKCRETGSVVSPATVHLFEARDPSVAELVSLDDKTYFHSEVAKLLYIGKRKFLEILFAVAYLTTRINVVA